jgi:hypothetical protein
MKKFNLFKKKLSLNKEVITVLDKSKLEKIVGGAEVIGGDTLVAKGDTLAAKTKADSIA